MERFHLWSYSFNLARWTFILVCSFSPSPWNHANGSLAWAQPAPAPTPGAATPASSPPSSDVPSALAEIPKYYQLFEAEAMYSMLKSWNDSGTNASALMADWQSNRTHPCNRTGTMGVFPEWYNCSSMLVHIGNLTAYEFSLTSVNMIADPEDQGGRFRQELVGEVPVSFRNLTNLLDITIDGHRKLTGPLPSGLFNKALPLLKTLTIRHCNLSGSITVATNHSGSRRVDLEELDLSDNSFTGSVPFCQNAMLYALQHLNLSSNQLSGEFCNNESTVLETIDISYNKFTNIGLRNDAFLLKFIYAQHNHLQRFPSQLLKLPQLQEVYLDSNNISGELTLPFISPSNSSMRLVSLINNNITTIKPSVESSSLFSESNLQKLEMLFLGGNPICKDARKDKILQMVCRFNRSSPIEDPYIEPSKTPIIISATISAFVLVAFIITLFVIKRLLKKISSLRKIQDEFDKKDVKPNLYSYTELKLATQDFHSKNELGRGGFGIVYKGVLKDGSNVAVKRLSQSRERKEKDVQDFLNEIIVVSNVKHRNLVQLKGCCIKEDQRILVYELVDNMSLATSLWGNSNLKGHLHWPTRFNIILGIARGLSYLHEEVEPPIIHRDIKGSNILLDKDLNPKIADFGLALFFPSLDNGESHMSISKVAGTVGYLSPEYATYGQVSTKLDIFSFGVLVLEIMSGRKNMDYKSPPPQQCLTQWAQILHAKNQVLELVDESFQPVEATTVEGAIIKRVVEVGLMCLHHSPSRRPSMSNIVAMLIGNTEVDKEIPNDGLGYNEGYKEGDVSGSSLPSMPSLTVSRVEEVFERSQDVESQHV